MHVNDPYLYHLLGKEKDMSDKFTHKPDKGTLFPNKFKKSDAHPDYVGTYTTAEGVQREIAAWKNGDYLSINFKNSYNASQSKASWKILGRNAIHRIPLQ